MKHRMWIIGWLGDKRCYLDMDKEEAIRRYKMANPEEFSSAAAADPMWLSGFEQDIDLVEFDDEFSVYDAWK